MNTSTIALGGLVGTSTMLFVMSILHWMKLANADMVRAIGSIYTRTYQGSYTPGLIIHYSWGMFFAFIYSKLVGFAPVITPESIITITTFTGFVHGLIVGLGLQVAVATYHPVPQFRKAGFAVVVAHIVGHVAYGLSLGIVFAFFINQFPLRPIIPSQ